MLCFGGKEKNERTPLHTFPWRCCDLMKKRSVFIIGHSTAFLPISLYTHFIILFPPFFPKMCLILAPRPLHFHCLYPSLQILMIKKTDIYLTRAITTSWSSLISFLIITPKSLLAIFTWMSSCHLNSTPLPPKSNLSPFYLISRCSLGLTSLSVEPSISAFLPHSQFTAWALSNHFVQSLPTIPISMS